MQGDKVRSALRALSEFLCTDGDGHRQAPGHLLSPHLLLVDVEEIQDNGVDSVGHCPALLRTPGEASLIWNYHKQ